MPHTFVVAPDEVRFLLVVEPAGFAGCIRARGASAERLEIPPPATEPPDLAAVAGLLAECGVDILGPPGIPA